MSDPFDPLASRAALIVYLDIKSPYAFVAKDPTYALADELDIDIDWRPLTLDIPSYLGSAKLDKRGKVEKSDRSAEQWGGVRYAYMDARRYASAWGYDLRGTEKIWDTRLVHLAMAWVKRADPSGRGAMRRFLDTVYPAFWRRELDVEDMAVVVSQIEGADVSARGFADWALTEGTHRHDERQAAIFSAGIYGVPGYVHNREYYFGREHLPHLRALLLGEASNTSDSAGAIDVGNALPDFATVAARGEGKHSVFLDMQRAAQSGRLEIVAGVNADCPQTHLALRTVEDLMAKHGERLHIVWGEVPRRRSVERLASPTSDDASRGDRHRAFRSNYQLDDTNRYVGRRSADNHRENSDRYANITITAEASVQLSAQGVNESFGYLFVDSAGIAHPFNGRSHLSALLWAFADV